MAKNLIVLASGWTGTTGAWYFMGRWFKEQGYDVMNVVYPYKGYAPIQYSAKAIGKLIPTGYDHCTFIGHSMGGLIGRYLIQHCSGTIDSSVTLGSPHTGTYTTSMAPWSQSASQMRYDSEFIKR